MNTAILEYPYVIEFYNIVNNKLESNNCKQNAVRLAYRDLQRTLRGFGKCSEKESIKRELYTLIENDYEQLLLPNINNELNIRRQFDIWHKTLCEKCKKVFDGKFNFTYGQAQKLINMFCKICIW